MRNTLSQLGMGLQNVNQNSEADMQKQYKTRHKIQDKRDGVM
jgi:hypothetical protein